MTRIFGIRPPMIGTLIRFLFLSWIIYMGIKLISKIWLSYKTVKKVMDGVKDSQENMGKKTTADNFSGDTFEAEFKKK